MPPSDSLFKQLQNLLTKVDDHHDDLVAKIQSLTLVVASQAGELKALKTLVYENAKHSMATPFDPIGFPSTPVFGELNDQEKLWAAKADEVVGTSTSGYKLHGKIEAIKSYKNRTGCGLKEAKDTVDAWISKWTKE